MPAKRSWGLIRGIRKRTTTWDWPSNGSGKFDAAFSQYELAVACNSENAQAHHNLGRLLHEQGKIKEAIDQYCEAIRLDPRYANAHRNLGKALQKQGRLDEAIEEFKQALALNPDNDGIRRELDRAMSDRANSGRRAKPGE